MKVLVVDDELVSRKKMEIILREYGDSHAVDSGIAAVREFSRALDSGMRYDLIFLDISLPDLAGTEVLKMIRKLEKSNGISDANRVKVLMVTSHGDAQTVRESIAAGCDDYIKKPFTVDLISGKLVKVGLMK